LANLGHKAVGKEDEPRSKEGSGPVEPSCPVHWDDEDGGQQQ